MKYKHFAKHILDVIIANTPAKHSTLIIRVEQGRIDRNFLQHEVKESFYPESEQNNKKTPLKEEFFYCFVVLCVCFFNFYCI